ncbi:hypothetical protein [Methanimicrococcus hacksteinii]|uniref:hypothetical protein n=1 Tax=Methanimicrococcus hacksteinii TaxID=3028293 RepID=UPI00298F2C5C|nr:hypothetical protein [Methanimicrococcus sp. At1]
MHHLIFKAAVCFANGGTDYLTASVCCCLTVSACRCCLAACKYSCRLAGLLPARLLPLRLRMQLTAARRPRTPYNFLKNEFKPIPLF